MYILFETVLEEKEIEMLYDDDKGRSHRPTKNKMKKTSNGNSRHRKKNIAEKCEFNVAIQQSVSDKCM